MSKNASKSRSCSLLSTQPLLRRSAFGSGACKRHTTAATRASLPAPAPEFGEEVEPAPQRHGAENRDQRREEPSEGREAGDLPQAGHERQALHQEHGAGEHESADDGELQQESGTVFAAERRQRLQSFLPGGVVLAPLQRPQQAEGGKGLPSRRAPGAPSGPDAHRSGSFCTSSNSPSTISSRRCRGIS